MKTKRQYTNYTTEFRSEALGITISLLYSWKKKAEEHANPAVNSDEWSELLALRKEVKILRMKK